MSSILKSGTTKALTQKMAKLMCIHTHTHTNTAINTDACRAAQGLGRNPYVHYQREVSVGAARNVQKYTYKWFQRCLLLTCCAVTDVGWNSCYYNCDEVRKKTVRSLTCSACEAHWAFQWQSIHHHLDSRPGPSRDRVWSAPSAGEGQLEML